MDASYHSDYSNIEENLAAMSSQLGDASLSTYVSNLDSDVSYVSLTEASRLGAPSQRLSSYASQGQTSYRSAVPSTLTTPPQVGAPPVAGIPPQVPQRPAVNPFSPQLNQTNEVERLRRLMHRLKYQHQLGQLSDEMFKLQYREVRTLYIEALEELVK